MQGRLLRKQYNSRIVQADGQERTVAHTHIQTTPIFEDKDDGNKPGLYIELCGVQNYDEEQVRSEFITLPYDAHVVYLMNDRGDTIHAYKWNPNGQVGNSENGSIKKEMKHL